MKVKLTCDVEPKLKTSSLKGIMGDWQYDFTPNDAGLLAKISIEAKVPDYTKYQIRFDDHPTPERPDGKIIVLLMDHDFNNFLLEEFQYFEGMLSILAEPVTISWQSPWIETIPESDEEKPHVIGGFRLQRGGSETEPPEVADSNIGNMINRAHFHSKVLNPYLSFFREAARERSAYRFINSFFNAYFVLEGAYGNQKWRNWEVREEFKKAPEFIKATQKVINDFIRKSPIIEKKILKMLSELKDRHGHPLNAVLDIEGMAHLLVATRGTLFHFSGGAESKGTPISHDEFEEISEVALKIAGETIWDFSQQVDDYVEQRKKEGQSDTSSRDLLDFDKNIQ